MELIFKHCESGLQREEERRVTNIRIYRFDRAANEPNSTIEDTSARNISKALRISYPPWVHLREQGSFHNLTLPFIILMIFIFLCFLDDMCGWKVKYKDVTIVNKVAVFEARYCVVFMWVVAVSGGIIFAFRFYTLQWEEEWRWAVVGDVCSIGTLRGYSALGA